MPVLVSSAARSETIAIGIPTASKSPFRFHEIGVPTSKSPFQSERNLIVFAPES